MIASRPPRAAGVALALALLAVAAGIFALGSSTSTSRAQTPEPGPEIRHLMEGHSECSRCHGAEGVRPTPASHAEFTDERCRSCHAPGPPPQLPEEEPPVGDSYCLNCHSNPNIAVRLEDGNLLSLYVAGSVYATEIRQSIHGDISCATCHPDKGAYPHAGIDMSSRMAYRARAVEECSRCHATVWENYSQSAHGQALLTGKSESAACYDCHSESSSGHAIRPVTGPEAVVAPSAIFRQCGRCHSHELDTYLETSHAKVVRFGDPQGAATCVTCHGAHDQKRVDDPQANLTKSALLVAVCRNCHGGATENFAAAWMGHRGASATRFPIVYFTERFFVFLTALMVGIGIIHVELDFFRWMANRLRRKRGQG